MKKSIASILCAALILPAALLAQSGNWADYSYRDTAWQYSTAANSTNYIGTAAELAQFAWVVNNVTNFANTVNIITDDINLAAHYWTPAGNSSRRFTGTLMVLTEESNVLIDGLTIDDANLDYAGLLGYIGSGGRVSSLTLTNVNISARQYAGGIVGYNSSGTITNCVNHGAAFSSYVAGGIAGYNASGTIANCVNHGAVSSSSSSSSSSSYAGGIAGYNSSGTIADCMNHGEVSSSSSYDSYAGGIAGYNSGTIANCMNHAEVSSDAPSSFYSYAGGIASYNSSGAIANCVNHGEVSSNASSSSYSYAGGIAGRNNSGTIADCVNHAEVSSSFSSYSYAGGIAGYNSSGVITDCMNHGAVASSSPSYSVYAGGIAGINASGTIANCINHGKVSSNATSYSDASSAGGIAGYNASGTIANCMNYGAVSSLSSYSSYSTSYYYSAGGIAGYNNFGTIINCVNHGMVSSDSITPSSSYARAGGIAGSSYCGTIANCANHGAVSSFSSSDYYYYAGGIAGINDSGTIANCVNHGAVSSDSHTGGIAGENNSGTIKNCHWNPIATGQNNAVGTGSGSVVDCATFGDAPGTLSTEVFGTASLLGALNAHVAENISIWGVRLKRWTLLDSDDGYPIFEEVDYTYWSEEINRNTAWNYSMVDNATNYIGTAAELAQFAWLVNDGNTFKGTVNIVTNSVDLAAHCWTPAGNSSRRFAGTLTAEPGVLIDGLAIDNAILDYAGLFGYVDAGGSVSSLTLANAIIFAGRYVGGIAGYNFGTIVDCVSHGAVASSFSSAGGIAGENSGTIANCVNHGVVSSSSYAGGIAGYNYSGTIINCVNHGVVSSSSSYAGGIAGENSGGIKDGNSGTIANCVNYGAVSSSSSAGGIAGENYGTIANCVNHGAVPSSSSAGGIAGGNRDSGTIANCVNHGAVHSSSAGGIAGGNSGTIVNCVNHGAVSSSSSSAGGIAGYNGGTIANCANHGTVSSSFSSYSYAGGIVGSNSGTIANCVSHGAVSFSSSSSSSYAGGIAGGNSYGTIKNCYWNPIATGQSNAVGNDSGSAVDCATFGDAPGTLDTAVFGTTSLLGALNAHVAENILAGGVRLKRWTLLDSPDSYPVFEGIDSEGNWADEAHRDTTWQYSTVASVENRIGTAAELAQFAWLVNNGTSFANTVTIITNSIELAAHYWTPAGNSSRQFSGALTAEPGVLIDGLTIDDAALNYAGLFGCIGAGGTVSSITLRNVNISAGLHVGGIAGFNSGTITNCVNHGAVSSYSSYAGGIAGENDSGTISDCVNHSSVSSYSSSSYVGGIVGINNGAIANCVNHGTVSSSSYDSYNHYIGGIAGHNSSGTIINCVNYGAVSYSSYCFGFYNYYAGGIAGYTSSGTIANCVNHGAVFSTDTSIYYAGGIAGYNSSGTIANCVNHGAVSSSSYAGGIAGYNSGTIANCVNHGAVSAASSYAGGIAGRNSSGTITNCVNHGAVSSSSSAGGIAGYNSGTIKNCYWNPIATGQNNVATSGSSTDCATFGDASGTLSTEVFGTTSLLDALNAYIAANTAAAGIPLIQWTLEKSPDGYPHIAMPCIVTFYLGEHGTRTGGGELIQTVKHGGAATAPTVQANIGWGFEGWDTQAFAANVTTPLIVNAIYSRAQYTVAFYLGEYGARTGGGALTQLVAHGEAAVPPEFDVNADWWFAEWDAPFDNVVSNMLVNAQYITGFPLALDTETTTLIWTTGGAAAWAPQLAGGHENDDCAASGAIGDSAESWIATTVAGPGTLSFLWRVSCENRYDFLQLTVNGEAQIRLTGETGWREHSIRFDDETPSAVRWSYVKDLDSSGGEDKAWLDKVLWLPDQLPPPTLEEALDATNLVWSAFGDAGWRTIKTSGASDGEDCARSGAIGDREFSALETTVSGPGVISFKWRSSCDEGGDWLDFWLDDNLIAITTGETAWKTITLDVPAGTHTLAWEYWKDKMFSDGDDCGYLDQVSWTPNQPNEPHSTETEPATTSTQVPVPHTWLDEHCAVAAGNYEAAANAAAANGMAVWECYLAGLDPTDANAKFVATIKIENGQVIIGQSPDLGEERQYDVFGKETLDAAWSFPTNSESRFFKVEVRMPEKN